MARPSPSSLLALVPRPRVRVQASTPSHSPCRASPRHRRFSHASSPLGAPSPSPSPWWSPPPPPSPAYRAHIPLRPLQKHLLSLGSALAALHNPARGDMIATLGETSGEARLPALRDGMAASAEGRALLADRPRITTQSISVEALAAMPRGSFGRSYAEWMEWCRVGPDTRAQVRYVSSPELAYVMQRYRESHDFYHLLLSMPVSTLGETVVKIFEASHFGLPVAYLSSLAGPLRLSPAERAALFRELGPWAWKLGRRSREEALKGGTLLGVYWEKRWEMDMREMRQELLIGGGDGDARADVGIDPPVAVGYDVKRGQASRTGKKKAWTTHTVERTRARAAAEAQSTSE